MIMRTFSTGLPVAGALAAILMAGGPVSADPSGAAVHLAQWGGGGYYVHPYNRPPPPPPPPGYYGPGYGPGYGQSWGGPPPGGYYVERAPRAQRNPNVGGACYTTRGVCPLGYPAPKGAPCRCNIPGFGTKRGNVI